MKDVRVGTEQRQEIQLKEEEEEEEEEEEAEEEEEEEEIYFRLNPTLQICCRSWEKEGGQGRGQGQAVGRAHTHTYTHAQNFLKKLCSNFKKKFKN